MRVETLEVIDGVESWRKALVQPEPFIVAGVNYYIKITHDTNFMQKYDV